MVCSYLTRFSQNWVKYLGFWGKKPQNIPQWEWYGANWPHCPPLNGAGYLQGKHVVLCEKKKAGDNYLEKRGKNIWEMLFRSSSIELGFYLKHNLNVFEHWTWVKGKYVTWNMWKAMQSRWRVCWRKKVLAKIFEKWEKGLAKNIFEKWGKCGQQLLLPRGGWISPQESVSRPAT